MTTQKESNWNFLLSDIEEMVQASHKYLFTELDDHVLTVELKDDRMVSVWQPTFERNAIELNVIEFDGTVKQSMCFEGVSDELIASLISEMITRSVVTS
jgi:hypothetical protein